MGISRRDVLYPYDEALAVRVANILGENSAASKALTELLRRREAGEEVGLYVADSALVVGPIDPKDIVD